MNETHFPEHVLYSGLWVSIVFWENWGNHNLLSRLSDLYLMSWSIEFWNFGICVTENIFDPSIIQALHIVENIKRKPNKNPSNMRRYRVKIVGHGRKIGQKWPKNVEVIYGRSLMNTPSPKEKHAWIVWIFPSSFFEH